MSDQTPMFVFTPDGLSKIMGRITVSDDLSRALVGALSALKNMTEGDDLARHRVREALAHGEAALAKWAEVSR